MRRRPLVAAIAAALFACNAILGIDGDVTDPEARAGDAGGDAPESDARAAGFSVSPSPLVIRQGATARLEVFAKDVASGVNSSFTIGALPPGVTARFPQVTVNGVGSAALELAADAFAPTGKASAAIAVERDGERRSLPVELEVVGPLDATFGDGGTAGVGVELLDAIPMAAHSDGTKRKSVGLAVLADQSLLVATTELDPTNVTHGVVVGLGPNGSPNAAFGDGGTRILSPGTRVYDMTVLANGSAMVVGSFTALVGSTGPELFATTMTAAGVEIGSGSRNAILGSSLNDAIVGLAPLPDAGAVGMIWDPNFETNVVVVESDASVGAPVPGVPAEVMEPFNMSPSRGGTVFVIGGTFGLGARGSVLRRRADGSIDPSWATNGELTPSAGASIRSNLRAGAPADGGYVFAGAVGIAANDVPRQLYVIRTSENGVVDPGFGDAGRVELRPRGDADVAVVHALVVEADGHILVGGYAEFAAVRHIAFARFDAKGALDRAFGVDGLVVVNLGRPAEVARIVRQGNAYVAAIVVDTASDRRAIVLVRLKP